MNAIPSSLDGPKTRENATAFAASEWCEWLERQEKTLFEEYRGRPGRLVSDFNGERTFIRDYVGREILELLQNSNDAAAKIGQEGRVHFELLPEGLIAANTGAPFSKAGIGSLSLPHTSPKPAEGSSVVGHKGLGFRSVLNWTRVPLIFSGELSIVFSARVAMQKQTQLELMSDELRDCIASQRSLAGALVIPLLAFPGYSTDGDLTSFLDDDAQRVIYGRCKELRHLGYDTVIGMPFDQDAARVAANKQVALLRPEVLLFAKNLSELEVVREGSPPVHWRRDALEKETARVYLDRDNSNYREWRVYSKQDAVPREHVAADQPSGMRYEAVIAIPTNHKSQSGSLYSYFPTEVAFPYPAICHATLDLQANRQQPQDTPANHFIIGQLAEFMAEIAEKLAAQSADTAGLALIAGETRSADTLEKFQFRTRLLNAAKRRAIIPTLAAGVVTPENARRLPFSDCSWLPKTAFEVLIDLPDGSPLRSVAELLDVRVLNVDEWRLIASNLIFTTVDERARFIAGILRHNVLGTLTFSGLLLDSDNRPVLSGHRVFLSPADQNIMAVPPMLEVRFLNVDLRQALLVHLKAKDQDGLASLLAPLGVVRYSTDSVLSALAAQANRLAEATPSREHEIRAELIIALWQLFPVREPRESRSRFPRDSRVLIRTRTGTYEDARKLYLSADCGKLGRILESLYKGVSPAKLIAPPDELLKLASADNIAEFFLWIGVAEFPREIKTDSPDYAFKAHIIESFSFPLRMGSDVFDSSVELGEAFFKDVTSLDAFDEFLVAANPAAILAWLAVDDRARHWKSPSSDHGKFGNRRFRAWGPAFFDGPIPSYVRWRLQSKKWLPTRNGQLASPQNCVSETARGLEDLLPIPKRPDRAELESFGIHPAFLRDAFDRAGVIPGFSQIDPDQLYELLTSLPARDPSGTTAKSVYRAILDHFDVSQISGSAARDRFRTHGQMWARCGSTEKYRAVKELWHIDSEDIPAALCAKLDVVALPKRSGSQKIEGLFGVKSVERGDIVRRISAHQPIYSSTVFSGEIDQLKPLILALRRSQMQRARESGEFKQLKIVVCSTISGEVEFQGQKYPLDLANWSWILEDQTHTAYILSDPTENEPLNSHLLADAVGQIFAAIFRIERGDEFARLVACQRKDRIKMLRRLIGDDDVPDMEELERRYRETSDVSDGDEVNMPRATAPVTPISAPPVTVNPIEPHALPPSPKNSGNDPLTIDPKQHEPSQPAGRIACRVAAVKPTGPRNLSQARRVTDGTFCEYKAMEFEGNDTPARYPVRVGNITGWNSPGVDVLSFASEEDRTNFLAGDHRETLVARFIEVKGRSSEGAKIDLRDNALRAAQKFNDKYFLYRLFAKGDATHELAILRNPLHDETGVRAFYEINLDAAKRTDEFNLVGGITENSYQNEVIPSGPPTQETSAP